MEKRQEKQDTNGMPADGQLADKAGADDPKPDGLDLLK